MVSLTMEQREKIDKYLNEYRDRLNVELSDKGWAKEREERTKLYRKILSQDHIDELSETEFAEVVKGLWASGIWTNKDYKVNKILKDNGIGKIRNALKALIYGTGSVGERFDLFAENIKGLGPSSITEMLAFIDSKQYCIWNDKPKNVLPLLGMKGLLPDRFFKFQISGEDYEKCNEVLGLIRDEMENQGFKNIDYLDVDILMWLLFVEVVKKEIKKIPEEKSETHDEIYAGELDVGTLTHWDVMGILLELGNLLGYDTYTADPSKKSEYLKKTLGELASLREIPGFTFKDTLEVVQNIDVIWFKNGEYPENCFEVEHTTGVTLGLLRLYQISPLKGIGFYVVAPSDVLPKFEKEKSRKPFKEIANRYIFKSYKDVASFYTEAKKYHEIKDKFLASK